MSGANQLTDKAVGKVLGIDIDTGFGVAFLNRPYLPKEIVSYQLLIKD